jgi:TadE-like protein
VAAVARVARGLRELDDRGAVYVEFLIVFMPVFLLFLGICQAALIGAARFVVQHAANRAARSAVVVLESSPDDFGGAPRGWVSRGSARGSQLPETLLRSFGFEVPSTSADRSSSIWDPLASVASASNAIGGGQQGARMAPVRFAAYMPLAVLAPLADWLEPPKHEGSLGDALSISTRARLVTALLYNRAGAVVTIQAGPAQDDLAVEPIGRKAPVTVRVTYLYYCSIPVVRTLACKSLAELVGTTPMGMMGLHWLAAPRDTRTVAQKRLASFLSLAEDPKLLARLDAAGARFAVLTAETTLPNQGAAYY